MSYYITVSTLYVFSSYQSQKAFASLYSTKTSEDSNKKDKDTKTYEDRTGCGEERITGVNLNQILNALDIRIDLDICTYCYDGDTK